ncbi:MAG: T9SS type A sorting domain-containing protein [Bacteroidota bacterium]
MKKLLFFAFTIFSANIFAQYTLVVVNGYGGGSYNAGDTVHVWCSAIPTNQVFDKWTGDISFLDSKDEWHTILVMPSQSISVSASFRTIGAYSINHESIMGRDTLKQVYSYFPPNFKGVIFCFHGTGGNATNWTTLFDYKQFLNDAVADTFGFIITEAEEITTQTDYNANAKLQWNYLPYDSTNVDFANIKILIDTFAQRGILNSATKFCAVGMSNGGAFASTIATFYNWKAAVSYCAQASPLLASLTTVPIQWCMAKYDNHPEVGPQGNANALANHNTLLSRGICSKYFSNDHSPVYPERFMRSGTITQTKANNLFAEFQSHSLLDGNNYLLYASDSIGARILAAPLTFPVFLSLTQTEKIFVATQVDVMYSAHQFYSDYNKKTLRFFSSLCDTAAIPVSISDFGFAISDFVIHPNPVMDELQVSSSGLQLGETICVYDLSGRVLLEQAISSSPEKIKTNALQAGVYFIRAANKTQRFAKF